MSLVHDIVKIKYSGLGYLPDYPPHLISDEEMFDAFLREEMDEEGRRKWLGFFPDTYPKFDNDFHVDTDVTFDEVYDALVESLQQSIQSYLEDNTAIPDWIYSFMMGTVVGPSSDIHDIENLNTLLKVDSEEFDEESAVKCYSASKNWLIKAPYQELRTRVPAVFGEPHVIKAYRVQAEVL